MLSATKHTLQKLQDLLETQGYSIRYEKGQFQAGHCLVEDRKMVVINKFYTIESRIQALSAILKEIKIKPEQFDDKQAAFYKRALKAAA